MAGRAYLDFMLSHEKIRLVADRQALVLVDKL